MCVIAMGRPPEARTRSSTVSCLWPPRPSAAFPWPRACLLRRGLDPINGDKWHACPGSDITSDRGGAGAVLGAVGLDEEEEEKSGYRVSDRPGMNRLRAQSQLV